MTINMKWTPLSILISFFYTALFAQSLQQPVDKIINQIDPNINMGMMVIDLNTGETLYQRDINKTLIPASNMKLFSDAAALLALGPDYRFQSKLSTDAKRLQEGVLHGSLYLYLPGDPSFTHAHLDILLASLQNWGVQRIDGNVVIVSDHQSLSPYAPGVVPKDLTYSYGAPTAPLMIDENRVTVTVNPSYQIGAPAMVEYSAPENTFILDSQVKTSSGACGISVKTTALNQLVVRGCMQAKQSAVQARVPIINPLSYAQSLIRNRLDHMHIQFSGEVVPGSMPKATLLLATHSSKPIKQLIADTLKPSDNLYANSLFLHAAQIINGSPIDWEKAQTVVKNYIQQQTQINLQSAILIDGSGLSRRDLITAEQTVSLLRYLHDRFPLAFEYIAALPIAGEDGTLIKRFRKPTQRGFLRAKTGSMTGIMSLSGYLYTANAHTLAFAIYINTKPGTKPAISGRYRGMVDSLCDFLLQQKPESREVSITRNAHARVAFQQKASQTDMIRARHAKWRKIEYAIKQSLSNQAINVVFRNEQLVLIDHGSDIGSVWRVLQNIQKKYNISIALRDTTVPKNIQQMSVLLWLDPKLNRPQRTWILQEVLS